MGHSARHWTVHRGIVQTISSFCARLAARMIEAAAGSVQILTASKVLVFMHDYEAYMHSPGQCNL